MEAKNEPEYKKRKKKKQNSTLSHTNMGKM